MKQVPHPERSVGWNAKRTAVHWSLRPMRLGIVDTTAKTCHIVVRSTQCNAADHNPDFDSRTDRIDGSCMREALVIVCLSLFLCLSCAPGGAVTNSLRNSGGIKGRVVQAVWQKGWQARIEMRVTADGIDIDSLRQVCSDRYAELRKAYRGFFPDHEFILYSEIGQDGAFEVGSLPEGTYSVVLEESERGWTGLCGEDNFVWREVMHVKVVKRKAAVVMLSGYCDRDLGQKLGPIEWERRYEHR
jgi:hypothetical protein